MCSELFDVHGLMPVTLLGEFDVHGLMPVTLAAGEFPNQYLDVMDCVNILQLLYGIFKQHEDTWYNIPHILLKSFYKLCVAAVR